MPLNISPMAQSAKFSGQTTSKPTSNVKFGCEPISCCALPAVGCVGIPLLVGLGYAAKKLIGGLINLVKKPFQGSNNTTES